MNTGMRMVLVGAALGGFACSAFDPDGPEDVRTVRLTLLPPNSQQEALGGTRPVQLAALRVEGGALRDIRVGKSVDPRTTQGLSVGIPKRGSWSLVLQTPRGGTSGLGQMVAQVQWLGPSGVSSRIPEASTSLELGSVEFETRSPSTLADNVVTVAADRNPLQFTDRDGDGTPDATDPDVDEDGLLNGADDDVDGDGLLDGLQTLASLPDGNGTDDGDGVPDDLE
jgi:hypothetical protein